MPIDPKNHLKNQSLPTCPYCGHRNEDPWDDCCDNSLRLNCVQCGAEFQVDRQVITTYTTVHPVPQ
jgi:DNA-directed RNA polymerase subunit RPC12/RpoP